MITLRVPFQIDAASGGLAVVSDTRTIVEQQIVDILVTNYAERLMAPNYGANLRTFLFSPARSELAGLKGGDIANLLNASIALATIVGCNMTVDPKSSNKLILAISYQIKPSSEILVLLHTISGIISTETGFDS